MTLKQIREMKRFPKGKNIVSVKDKAELLIFREEHKTKTGRKSFMYTGRTIFVYENGKTYEIDVKGKGLQKVIEKSLIKFEQRNKQMKGYQNVHS